TSSSFGAGLPAKGEITVVAVAMFILLLLGLCYSVPNVGVTLERTAERQVALILSSQKLRASSIHSGRTREKSAARFVPADLQKRNNQCLYLCKLQDLSDRGVTMPASLDEARTGNSIADLKQAILDNLYYIEGRIPALATPTNWYMALAYSVR